ncbi:MAG: tRNA (adenosine(37)-N6)-threonylcarbamoyltransferase complex dimerization subunit type 1 TsaB [Oscillospiraceae bacterium]|nr:tRNA (adenosine(37)-N6)-threonylcarbamoyltransferase complex dimerization subunit type 1 TsaB [Oscillospiraceae bacterium]
MIIVGVDCSSKQGSVAITRDDKPLYQCVYDSNMTHSQNLLSLIENAITVCGISKDNIDLFAVTLGPGSFTGLRIGLALVKGMAMALDKPCVGVSSLAAMAKAADLDGTVVPCFDARRGQVYCNITAKDGSLIATDDCRMAADLEEYVKNTADDVYFVGDGMELCYNKYGHYPNVKKHSVLMPCTAYGACLLAKDIPQQTHFELSPSYLRLSQAEKELKEKSK